ncbi:MAG: hypothetical protein JW816_04720 [Candidatus Buchananbacteria bacterium]|nr:hypothetical protein [Candidatus Buchananbacteria bacterium]
MNLFFLFLCLCFGCVVQTDFISPKTEAWLQRLTEINDDDNSDHRPRRNKKRGILNLFTKPTRRRKFVRLNGWWRNDGTKQRGTIMVLKGRRGGPKAEKGRDREINPNRSMAIVPTSHTIHPLTRDISPRIVCASFGGDEPESFELNFDDGRCEKVTFTEEELEWLCYHDDNRQMACEVAYLEPLDKMPEMHPIDFFIEANRGKHSRKRLPAPPRRGYHPPPDDDLEEMRWN